MKNVYKWRITNLKYAYLLDETGEKPFVYYKSTKERYYGEDSAVTNSYVDEAQIATVVGKIVDGNVYKKCLDNLKTLCRNSSDVDVQSLVFLDDISKYFNLDNEECVKEASVAKCEGYEPVIQISATTIPYGEQPRVDLNVNQNPKNKTITYDMLAYIPEGKPGEDGDTIPCCGPQGEPGRTPTVTARLGEVETVDYPSSAEVNILTGSTPTSDLDLVFDFKIPRGGKGDIGLNGNDGDDGLPAEFGVVSGTCYPLPYGEEPKVDVSSDVTYGPSGNPDFSGKTIQITNLGLKLGIPEGKQGIQGEQGLPAKFNSIGATVVQMLPVREPATVSAMTVTGPDNTYDLMFEFALPWPEKGDKGEKGNPGSCEGCEGGGNIPYCFSTETGITDGSNPVFEVDTESTNLCINEKFTFLYPEKWGKGGTCKPRGYVWTSGETTSTNEFSVNSFAEGEPDSGDTLSQPIATGYRSHAEGAYTKASGNSSHAEGTITQANGNYSHAEGTGTEAKGNASHTEGSASIGIGFCSHAEGGATRVEGSYSHAEGYNTQAIGDYSHTEGYSENGYHTITPSDAIGIQTSSGIIGISGAIGIISAAIVNDTILSGKTENYDVLKFEYNDETYYVHVTIEPEYDTDENKWCLKFLEERYIPYMGVDENPHNLVLYRKGSLIAVEDNSHAEGNATKTFGKSSHAEGNNTITSSDKSHTEGTYSISVGESSHAEGYMTISKGNNSHAEGNNTRSFKDNSHAEGCNTESGGIASHTEGNTTKTFGDYSHAEGSGTTASGAASHTEGSATIGIGTASHAEGERTTASGWTSHAEGRETKAYGDSSHAEGYYTITSGFTSHAEGSQTSAITNYSHAEGYCTIANYEYQHVQGKYNENKPDNSMEIGWGDDNDRRNIFEVTTGGTVNSTNGFFQTSDIRKKNILGEIDLNKAYDLIDKCSTILYTLKGDESNKERVGMIAQEVKEFFPELISEDSNGTLSLDYPKLTVVILRVMKDLINRISKLENK